MVQSHAHLDPIVMVSVGVDGIDHLPQLFDAGAQFRPQVSDVFWVERGLPSATAHQLPAALASERFKMTDERLGLSPGDDWDAVPGRVSQMRSWPGIFLPRAGVDTVGYKLLPRGQHLDSVAVPRGVLKLRRAQLGHRLLGAQDHYALRFLAHADRAGADVVPKPIQQLMVET